MRWKGVIIEESLTDLNLLRKAEILSTKREHLSDPAPGQPLTWHLHSVLLKNLGIDNFAKQAQKSLKPKWYMDFQTDDKALVIFSDKYFKFSKDNKETLEKLKKHGEKLGIPKRQLDFDKLWK